MPTLTPDQDELNQAHNPGQENFDEMMRSRFSPEEEKAMEDRAQSGHQDDLKSREEQASGQSRESGGDEDRDILDREKEGDSNWKTDVSQQNSTKGSSNSSFTSAKSAGTAFGLIGIIVATTLALGSLMLGALGIVNLKEVALQRVSARFQSVMDQRLVRVQTRKFTNELTNGCTVHIKCRYRGMTNREIKKFNRRAITEGWQIEKTTRSTIPPFKHKVEFQKIDGDGKVTRTVAASDFKKSMRSDPSLRKSVSKFYSSKVEIYSGKAAKGVWTRTKTFIGKRTTKKGVGDTEDARQKSRIRTAVREAVSGEVGSFRADKLPASETGEDNAKADKATEAVQEVIQDEVDVLDTEKADSTKSMHESSPETQAYTDRYKGSIEKVEKIGGGVSGLLSPLGGLQNICMVKMLLVTANNTKRISQAVQLIRFAVMYTSLADRIKAGDADADTSTQINDSMTLMNQTGPQGLTGFDSMGYNWLATGAVRTSGNEDVGKYQNGGPGVGILGPSLSEALASPTLNTACRVAYSKEALVISIGLTVAGVFTGGVSAVAASGAKVAAEKAVSKAVSKAIQREVKKKALKEYLQTVGKGALRGGVFQALFVLGVPPLISAAARTATSTVITGDEQDTEAGNAFASGIGATNSKTSQANGLEPISVSESVNQDKIAYASQLKIAKEEGINHFDTSNPYSFTNKLAVLASPGLMRISSVASIPTGLANISGSFMKSINSTTYAKTSDDDQYKYCQDSELEKADVAGDPFCNPQYGMASGITNGEDYDPEKVIEYLYDRALVSEDGRPQNEFQDFIETCMNTNSPLGDEDYCTKKDSQNYTMMRLYCMDTSIDNDMSDGDGIGCAPDVNTVGGVSDDEDSAGSLSSPETIDMATLYEPSTDIKCAEGSKDLGVISDAYHANSKFKARLCAINNVPETGDLSDVKGANGKLVVNSRVSGVIVKMAQDAKAAGTSGISAAEGYRSMKRQQYLYTCGCTGGNPVAKPGTSNHQSGVAIDWNEPMRAWVVSNGEKYGYKWFGAGDPPHFSPDGR